MTTTDTEDNISTKISRNKISFSTLVSQKHRRERANFSNKAPIRATRDLVILPSFKYQQKQGDVTPKRIEICDLSHFQTINQGLERRGSVRVRDNRFIQINYPFSRKLIDFQNFQNNLFQLNASKASLHEKQKENLLCPPQEHDICERTISSFHREQSVSILSKSRTKVFDSVRASSSGMSSADLGDRLKEIDDLNELMGEMQNQRVHTDFFNYTSFVPESEKKVMKKKKKSDSLQTESNSDRKQYSNLSQLLDTEDSVDRVILPKLFTPKVSTNAERNLENHLKENFKKMINKGIGRDPQCKKDPLVIAKINQDGLKFQRKLRHITKNLHVM